MILQPLHFVLAVLSGWLNEHQTHVVDYLREENRLLKQQLRGQRLRLSDDDRRRLAAKGVLLGRKLLAQVATAGRELARVIADVAGGDPWRSTEEMARPAA